jgi:hypothetical protein
MRTTNSVRKEVKTMEEIRNELTREELEAQTVELLPDREEMQAFNNQLQVQAFNINPNQAAVGSAVDVPGDVLLGS